MMRVIYVGPFGQKSGYGHACHDNIAALVSAGVDVRIFPIMEFDTDDVPERFKHLLEFVVGETTSDEDRAWPTHVIVHAIPHGLVDLLANAVEDLDLDRKCFKAVAYTTWETNKFPDGVMELVADTFDRVLFPCAWNAETYRRVFKKPFDPTWYGEKASYDINRRLQQEKAGVVNHALSPEWWAAAKRARPAGGPFIFLWVGTWTERKNPIGLLQAYFSEFRAGENVLLKIVTPSFPTEDVASLARSSFFDELPTVEIVGKAGMRLSEEEMRQLYADADCYVTLARGEGWGLGAFEAAAVGIPVICPAYGGFLDFISVGFKGIECYERAAWTPETTSGNVMRVAGMEIKPLLVNAPNGVRIDQLWAEPNMKQAMQFMRSVYTLATEGGSYVVGSMPDMAYTEAFRENFSWKTIGAKFVAELERA